MENLVYIIGTDDTTVIGERVGFSNNIVVRNPIYYNEILRRYQYCDEKFGKEKEVFFPLASVKRYGSVSNKEIIETYQSFSG